MKKSLKLLTIIALVVVLGLFAFTGCSQTPFHKFLNTNWNKTEREVAEYSYEYKQKGKETITGTLVTKLSRVTDKNKSFKIGDKQFDVKPGGSIYEYELKTSINESIKSIVYFKGNDNRVFMPVASYTERDIDNKLTTIMLEYNGNNVKSTVTIDGKTTVTNSDVKKGLVFDNIQLPVIARSIDFTQKGTLTFTMPTFMDNGIFVKNIAMGAAGTMTLNKEVKEGETPDTTFSFINDGKKFDAVQVLLSINEKPAGLPVGIYVANGTFNIKNKNDGTVKQFIQPIVQIAEGSDDKGASIYKLTNMYLETI